ncbi:hypothetical protein C5167_029810 [Papaver somniferum]|nr:hypothetical protein C5167_029810 [Papaver somniferum]
MLGSGFNAECDVLLGVPVLLSLESTWILRSEDQKFGMPKRRVYKEIRVRELYDGERTYITLSNTQEEAKRLLRCFAEHISMKRKPAETIDRNCDSK